MDRRWGIGHDLPVGAAVDGYRIRGTLGVGGCATVYLAEDRGTGARVALKVPHLSAECSPELIARFAREVTLVERVRHPGVVAILSHGQLEEGRPYYVMELLDGATLDAVLKDRGRLGPAEVLEICVPLCAALDAVHRAGIVHRDLKASNILLGEGSAGRVVKIVDFGIAKLLHPDAESSGDVPLTTSGGKLGTPTCMAPEQIRGLPVDARADLYALGVLLFRMLTGRFPFRGDNLLEIESGHLETPPPRPSLLAPVERAVDAVVLRCLQKRPEDRYPGVLDLLADLHRTLIPADVEPLSEPPPSRDGDEPTPHAVAIYVEVLAPSGLDPDREDAVLAEIGALIDIAERELLTADFELPVQTGSALLGVRLLPTSPSGQRRAWQQATDLAARIRADLTARTPTDPAEPLIELLLCVHEATATVKPSPTGPRVAGGPILCLASWVPLGRRGHALPERGPPVPLDDSPAKSSRLPRDEETAGNL